MGLLIGSDYIIANRNTYWVLINLVMGSVVAVYFIMYLLGFIDFFGDATIPGLAWKIPAMVAIFIGNIFVVTMQEIFLLPALALQVIVVIAAIMEAYLIGGSTIGCLSGTSSIPCDSGDQFVLVFLAIIMLAWFFGTFYALLSIVEYLRGLNRVLRYIESERGAAEFEEQTFVEEGL